MKEQERPNETTQAGLAAFVSTAVFFGCAFNDNHLLLSSAAAVVSGAIFFLLARWIRAAVQ